jgi:hypothetical protein
MTGAKTKLIRAGRVHVGALVYTVQYALRSNQDSNPAIISGMKIHNSKLIQNVRVKSTSSDL